MLASSATVAPLTPSALTELTRFFAAEVAAGHYPFVRYDENERWHQRIYRDQRVDVWLISWMPAQGTALHDHGGSAGAFTVIEGELTETIAAPGSAEAASGLREVVRRAGRSVGFPAAYIHDVRNAGRAPAVSVHAYSSPLTSMTYFDVDEASGRLVPLATVRTDDPEHELAAADLRAAS